MLIYYPVGSPKRSLLPHQEDPSSSSMLRSNALGEQNSMLEP
jgi:hypothetical protein